MKALQITLFLIANVIFLSQAGNNVHHLVFGTEPSVLDKFEPEKQKARSEAQLKVLLADYQIVSEEIRLLENGKKSSEVRHLEKEHSEVYEKKFTLRSEILSREEKSREMRDLWIFCGYGFFLIVVGSAVYRRRAIWPGFAIVVTGFSVLEYWASPSFFGGGAVTEYHQLLLSKTIFTFLALVVLYIFWMVKGEPNQTLRAAAAAPGS